MKDLPENELLSAYLDGELTAAEQAEVKQLLARSPAARQLLEELRALSSRLQSLPQSKLGEDLSQQVLRIALRRTLLDVRASLRRVNDADGKVQLLGKSSGKEVAHGRERRRVRSWLADRPLAGQIVLWEDVRCGELGEDPHFRSRLEGRSSILSQARFHVGLTGSEPHVSDQDVVQRNRVRALDELPMVRALFVLRVADLKSPAASVQQRPDTAAEAPY